MENLNPIAEDILEESLAVPVGDDNIGLDNITGRSAERNHTRSARHSSINPHLFTSPGRFQSKANISEDVFHRTSNSKPDDEANENVSDTNTNISAAEYISRLEKIIFGEREDRKESDKRTAAKERENVETITRFNTKFEAFAKTMETSKKDQDRKQEEVPEQAPVPGLDPAPAVADPASTAVVVHPGQRTVKVADPERLDDNISYPLYIDWKIEVEGKFIENFDHFLNDGSKKRYIFGRTKGLARRYLSPRMRADSPMPFVHSNDMFEFLSSNFIDPYARQAAIDLFNSQAMRQNDGERYMQYRSRFMAVATEAEIPLADWSESLWNKLHPTLKREVMGFKAGLKTFALMNAFCSDIDGHLTHITNQTAEQNTFKRAMAALHKQDDETRKRYKQRGDRGNNTAVGLVPHAGQEDFFARQRIATTPAMNPSPSNHPRSKTPPHAYGGAASYGPKNYTGTRPNAPQTQGRPEQKPQFFKQEPKQTRFDITEVGNELEGYAGMATAAQEQGMEDYKNAFEEELSETESERSVK